MSETLSVEVGPAMASGLRAIMGWLDLIYAPTFTHRIPAERLIRWNLSGGSVRGIESCAVSDCDAFDCYATTRRGALILATLSIPSALCAEKEKPSE